MRLLLSLALSISAFGDSPKDRPEIREEVTVRAKGGGPPLQLPPPTADKAVLQEVLSSLKLLRDGPPAATVRLSAWARRLELPFPEPPYLALSPKAVAADHDSWAFEVLEEGRVVWRSEGRGRIAERIAWEGTGPAGEMAARVGRSYQFRFTGRGEKPFVISSEPLALKSLSYRDNLGRLRLEAAVSELFQEGKAAWRAGSDKYLAALAGRLRLLDPRSEPALFVLYAEKPKSALARARARTLRLYFSKRLLVAPSLVAVDILARAGREEAVACLLPPEAGAAIRARD